MVTKEQLILMSGSGQLHFEIFDTCLQRIQTNRKPRIVRLIGTVLTDQNNKHWWQTVRYGIRMNLIITPETQHYYHTKADCPFRQQK